jgi:hypothetical protein
MHERSLIMHIVINSSALTASAMTESVAVNSSAITECAGRAATGAHIQRASENVQLKILCNSFSIQNQQFDRLLDF